MATPDNTTWSAAERAALWSPAVRTQAVGVIALAAGFAVCIVAPMPLGAIAVIAALSVAARAMLRCGETPQTSLRRAVHARDRVRAMRARGTDRPDLAGESTARAANRIAHEAMYGA